MNTLGVNPLNGQIQHASGQFVIQKEGTVMGNQELISRPTQEISGVSEFMPVFDIGKAVQRRNMLVEFVQQIMVKDVDYGSPAGSGKPSLLKPGAEKLCTFFGLTPEFEITAEVEDWTGAQHNGESFFYFRYKCRLSRNGRAIGEGEGSCNTWESKYRYRWVKEDYVKANGFVKDKLVRRGGTNSEFVFAVDKAETTGTYGKPAEHWQAFKDAIKNGTARKTHKRTRSNEEKDAWEIDATEYRVPNPDVADQVNTCQKMAQKRALVAAVLISVNASEYFTQDIEDLEPLETQVSPPAHGAMESKEAEVQYIVQEQKANKAADEIPAAVRRIWSEMSKGRRETFIQAFIDARDTLTDLQGEDGYRQYQEIMARHGIGQIETYKGKMQPARNCILELFHAIQAITKPTEATE